MALSALLADDPTAASLTIDLPALQSNYRLIAERVAPAKASANIKANAYGLGIDLVVPALVDAGCSHFFVATISEGLSARASAPHAPRTRTTARGGGRNAGRVHADPPPRVRPRDAARLCAQSPARVATPVRALVDAVSGIVPAQSRQQALCAASAPVVRAESPRRRLRGDVRRLAASGIGLEAPLRRVAGAPEAAVRRPAHARTRRRPAVGANPSTGRPVTHYFAHAVRALYVPACPVFRGIPQHLG